MAQCRRVNGRNCISFSLIFIKIIKFRKMKNTYHKCPLQQGFPTHGPGLLGEEESIERMTALVMSYYQKLLKFSVNTTLIILDLVLWMEVTSSLSPGRSVSRECYSCLMRRCRYTMVVLWGIVVP